jgi:hypothetical protein
MEKSFIIVRGAGIKGIILLIAVAVILFFCISAFVTMNHSEVTSSLSTYIVLFVVSGVLVRLLPKITTTHNFGIVLQ